MSIGGHEGWEVLINASLTGELSGGERRQLDAHLDSCARCRDTLAAFAAQRRIVAGLRHVPVPRDLGARVRTGIAAGVHADQPWWRRPVVLFAGVGGGLAAVAGALLAVVMLTGPPNDAQVGVGNESPAFAPSPTAPATRVATPAATPLETASPPTAPAQESPEERPAEPDVYLAYTGPFDNLLLTLRDGRTGDPVLELDAPGPPVAAELSPDGQWLAYVARVGDSGLNEIRATRIARGIAADDPGAPPAVDSPINVGETVILGQSVAGSEFLEHLSWSSNSHYLAYTVADPDGGGTDAWVFEPSFGEPRRLSDVGNAYAGSWVPGSAGTSMLWISTAGDQPMSYLHAFHDSAGDADDARLGGSRDPAENPIALAEGIFQPLLSPNGDRAIYWRGVMQPAGDEWVFVGGGAPYLAEARFVDTKLELADERPLFSDVTIDRDAFTSAGIAWGADSDAYAVWGARWTGISHGTLGVYPDPRRVYFGHATDPRELTEFHAIDETDLPDGASVVDVKVPTTRHLAVTAQLPIGGVMEAPAARLVLVTRNTGAVADDIEVLPSRDAAGWFGPAAYDAYWDAIAP